MRLSLGHNSDVFAKVNVGNSILRSPPMEYMTRHDVKSNDPLITSSGVLSDFPTIKSTLVPEKENCLLGAVQTADPAHYDQHLKTVEEGCIYCFSKHNG